MKNIGCRIVKEFNRPSKDVVDLFKRLPVPNIDDCMGRLGAVAPEIRPMNKAPLLGTAFTVKVPAGDNLMFHKAMDMAQPGDVIVIDADGYTERAILGEIMLSYCKSRKLAGVIVDGSIRDADALEQMDIPVYARGITPDGPYKNGPGEINTTVTFGGKVVKPGDIIVGDADGIVIIDPDDAKDLAEKARKITDKEVGIMKNIVENGKYERPWVDEVLKDLQVEYI
ncbi:RraA family protein [Salinicoccus sp. Marseille-QA3877]